MNRRQFFQRSGLSAATLFFAPSMIAASYKEAADAEETLAHAIRLLQAHGADYVDARLGSCEIHGHGEHFPPLELFREEMLGMRFHVGDGWRNVVLRDFSPEALEAQIAAIFESKPLKNTREALWIVCRFDTRKLIASKTTDSTKLPHLNAAAMRFAQPAALPRQGEHFLFCDLLIEN